MQYKYIIAFTIRSLNSWRQPCKLYAEGKWISYSMRVCQPERVGIQWTAFPISHCRSGLPKKRGKRAYSRFTAWVHVCICTIHLLVCKAAHWVKCQPNRSIGHHCEYSRLACFCQPPKVKTYSLACKYEAKPTLYGRTVSIDLRYCSGMVLWRFS